MMFEREPDCQDERDPGTYLFVTPTRPVPIIVVGETRPGPPLATLATIAASSRLAALATTASPPIVVIVVVFPVSPARFPIGARRLHIPIVVIWHHIPIVVIWHGHLAALRSSALPVLFPRALLSQTPAGHLQSALGASGRYRVRFDELLRRFL